MQTPRIDTVRLSDDGSALVIIDQTLLPGELKYLSLTKTEDIWEAIRALRVRGAPAIGVAAGFGAYLAAKHAPAGEAERSFYAACDYLATSRPTAVNLFYALERMKSAMGRLAGRSEGEIVAGLRAEAQAIMDDDLEMSQRMGEHGRALIKPGMGILTHCNAGSLATAFYGTALGVVYAAAQEGLINRVYADETRPVNQGARLTAWELARAGVPVTLQCDDMAASLMAEGKVDAVIVGADRIAANGDTANKVGTLGLAIMARHFQIPFYVAAPRSTIDCITKTGDDISIEERDSSEVLAEPLFGVTVRNPAFDVTPYALVTAIITEDGIWKPLEL